MLFFFFFLSFLSERGSQGAIPLPAPRRSKKPGEAREGSKGVRRGRRRGRAFPARSSADAQRHQGERGDAEGAHGGLDAALEAAFFVCVCRRRRRPSPPGQPQEVGRRVRRERGRERSSRKHQRACHGPERRGVEELHRRASEHRSVMMATRGRGREGDEPEERGDCVVEMCRGERRRRRE